VSTIAEWLVSLGMPEYTERFAEERIETDVLPELTDQDLERLGIPLGHRRRMLKSIRELGQPPPAAPRVEAAASPAPQDRAERRQLTVVFCDLVGSTALSARLDPEDLRGIIGTYHGRCTELIERNGGFVAKYMGDGVLGYFGYPQAHEHDAERAVRAALNLVEAIPKLATHARSPMQVRVGIATGLVVVGDLIGAGAAQEQAVVGETPNLAARLQALAEPGAVVIAASTRRLTGGLFEYRDLGGVALKGFDENVPAFQVLGLSTAESRFEALRTAATPLVGRDEEIESLTRRWHQAKESDGCVALISGEAGIGKSRIAQTVLARLSGEPHTPLRLFCSPHHQDSALYPTIAQLERAAGFRREDTVEQRLDKLEAVLAHATNNLGEAASLIADLLSIPTGGRYPALNLPPQKRKEKTLRALIAQVEGLASQKPVLMVFEDVHWSDPTTRELLDLLVDAVSTLRVLVIMTFRPEFGPPWVGRSHVTLLTLNRLPRRQRAEMISRVTGGKTLPEEIANQIVDRTDGVPLFIEELTKSVVESSILTDIGDRYTVTGPLAPLAIPTSLHASLLARLDRLTPTREVVQIAAALGRQFSHELITAVARMPERQLDDALEQLVAAELVFRRGRPPDAEYTFKHALVQDAAYSTLLRSRGRELHGRIAATLEGRFPEIVETQPELLARHCTEAGLVDKSVAYWTTAGQRSASRWAMSEALNHLTNGLSQVTLLPDSAERQRKELNLQVALAGVLFTARGPSAKETGSAYTRARELCEKLRETALLPKILYGQWLYFSQGGQLEMAQQMSEDLLRSSNKENSTTAVLGHFIAGFNSFIRGDLNSARLHLEETSQHTPGHLALVDLMGFDPVAASHGFLALTLCCLGYLEQALVQSTRAVEEGRKLVHPPSLAMAFSTTCRFHWLIQDIPAVSERSQALISLATEHVFPFWATQANAYRGWLKVKNGHEQEGLNLAHQALRAYEVTQSAAWVPFLRALLSKTYQEAGETALALSLWSEAESAMRSFGERWYEAELYRLKGDLLSSSHEHDPNDSNDAEAAACFVEAMNVARRQNARLWELRAAISLARLWRDQGNRNEARDILAPIYGWFTEGFDTLDLKQAKFLLDELSA
jgi:class 3 adenylate cyclase/tetratricopeptide (TPR) repeat protein